MLLSRSVRAFGVVATVTAAVPLVLTGCTAEPQLDLRAAELQTQADSDLLEIAAPQVYDVANTELIEPTGTTADTSAFALQLSTSGFILVTDDVVTDAELELEFGGRQQASFDLTEPAPLRPAGSEVDTVTATGTLTVNGVVRPNTHIRLTPTSLDTEQAIFEASFRVPDNPVVSGTGLPVDYVTLRFTLDARDAE